MGTIAGVDWRECGSPLATVLHRGGARRDGTQCPRPGRLLYQYGHTSGVRTPAAVQGIGSKSNLAGSARSVRDRRASPITHCIAQ